MPTGMEALSISSPRGWRAEAAICLGRLSEENAPQIARIVLMAYLQGLP